MNSSTFNWGLVGPGKIAHRFVEALHTVPTARLAHVVGRDLQRAAAFAQTWDAPQAGTELAAMLADPQIHAVYIATPHAQHGEAIRACLLAGKPVLCEKPLVPHGALGRELVALARERRVFLMEALWTRFLPTYIEVGAWLRSGAIGRLRTIQSSFCFSRPFEPHTRLFAPELAGGSLLDIGIYNLSVTRWVVQQCWGQCPEPSRMNVSGQLAPTGVDQRVGGMLEFDRGDADGVTAQFVCGFDSVSDNALHIGGELGSITMPHLFSAAEGAVLRRPGQADQTLDAPFRCNGFEGEIEAAMASIRAGETECPTMPLDETLTTLHWMDLMRAQLGVRYPFE